MSNPLMEDWVSLLRKAGERLDEDRQLRDEALIVFRLRRQQNELLQQCHNELLKQRESSDQPEL